MMFRLTIMKYHFLCVILEQIRKALVWGKSHLIHFSGCIGMYKLPFGEHSSVENICF